MSMTGALQVVQAVVSLSFLVLGVSTVIDWLRRRERNLGYLALALGTLGLTSVLGQFNTRTEYRFGTLMGDITLVLLMTSGYALLLFRDSFIPLSRRLRIGALVLCVAVTAAALVGVGPVSPAARPTSVQLAATIALVLVWAARGAEPIVPLWAASRGPPAVQPARLPAPGRGPAGLGIIPLGS